MSVSYTLATLPRGVRGQIADVVWDRISAVEGRRLRELGVFPGRSVAVVARGSLFARTPVAIEIGRMRLMLSGAQAAAITVAPEADSAA